MSVCFRIRRTADIIKSPAVKRSLSRYSLSPSAFERPAKASLREFDGTGTAQLRSFLVRIEKINHRDAHKMRFDGIKRSDEPLRRTCTCIRLLRPERFT